MIKHKKDTACHKYTKYLSSHYAVEFSWVLDYSLSEETRKIEEETYDYPCMSNL